MRDASDEGGAKQKHEAPTQPCPATPREQVNASVMVRCPTKRGATIARVDKPALRGHEWPEARCPARALCQVVAR
eukprot:13793018-Alexandrium_andersonii.AAC.1